METLIIIIFCIASIFLTIFFMKRNSKPAYEYSYSGKKEKELEDNNERMAILNNTYVQESIKTNGKYYPATVLNLKGKFELFIPISS